MNETTNPQWPDPAEWAQRLYDRLEVTGEGYVKAPSSSPDDPEALEGLSLKQARAAEALLVTYSALKELPLFERSKGAAILHDLAGALRDVVLGGSPRLFVSVRPGSPGSDGIHKNYVKIHVVLAVRFLTEAHGASKAAAIKTVTGIFAKAGAKGRKGNPLSATTVKDWCEKAHPLAENFEEARIHREVQQRMDKFREEPDWPGRYEDAVTWIEGMASHPLLSNKYG